MPAITNKPDKKQEKYDRILSAAEALVTRDGLTNLSMNALAREAKVAKGTLYLYFEHKEAVLAALTTKARLELLAAFQRGVAKEQDHLNKLRSLLWTSYQFANSYPLHSELVSFYELNSHLDQTNGKLAEASHKISAYVQSVLDEAKAAGAIRANIDTSATTFIMWGICNGINQMIEVRSRQIKEVTGQSSKQFFDYMVDLFVQGLR